MWQARAATAAANQQPTSELPKAAIFELDLKNQNQKIAAFGSSRTGIFSLTIGMSIRDVHPRAPLRLGLFGRQSRDVGFGGFWRGFLVQLAAGDLGAAQTQWRFDEAIIEFAQHQ